MLLAEDNAINSKLAVRLLKKLGCEVDVAGTGNEALTLLKTTSYDIVFMDCQMPEMDGFEATRAARRWEQQQTNGTATPGRRLPIIALTANAMQGDRERCIEVGMDDYVTKPIDPKDLKRILDTWTQRPAATVTSLADRRK